MFSLSLTLELLRKKINVLFSQRERQGSEDKRTL